MSTAFAEVRRQRRAGASPRAGGGRGQADQGRVAEGGPAPGTLPARGWPAPGTAVRDGGAGGAVREGGAGGQPHGHGEGRGAPSAREDGQFEPPGESGGRPGEPSPGEPSPGERGRGLGQDGRDRVVAVTGAARGLGRALAARLAARADAGRVVAIDDQRGDLAGVTWRLADVRDPALAGRLAGVDVLVHTDLDTSAESDPRSRRTHNVRAAQTVLTAAAAGQVGRVILVTSAVVYGARPDNPVPLPETAPLRADPDGSVAGDLVEIEDLARRARRAHPGMGITVARPAALVGDGGDTAVARFFGSPRLLAVKGCPPRWQFCHIDDLVSALEFAVRGDVDGDFAVGCDGWLEQEQVTQISGLRWIELPAALTFGAAQRLHRIGVAPTLAGDMASLVYPWVVECRSLRAAGWRPAVDNAGALRALIEARSGQRAGTRRLPRKEATLTAAGATVAVLGAAAVVRRARSRRRG